MPKFLPGTAWHCSEVIAALEILLLRSQLVWPCESQGNNGSWPKNDFKERTAFFVHHNRSMTISLFTSSYQLLPDLPHQTFPASFFLPWMVREPTGVPKRSYSLQYGDSAVSRIRTSRVNAVQCRFCVTFGGQLNAIAGAAKNIIRFCKNIMTWSTKTLPADVFI